MAFEFAGVWIAIAYVFLTHCTHFTLGQYLATPDDLNAWLRTTGTTANVDFIGSDFNTPLGPTDVRLIYCSERIENTTTCGGNCFAYQGPGSQCLLPVLGIANCLAATRNVHMCFTKDCNDCNLYNSCGTRLDNGFCFTPQTNSIRLPVYVNDIIPSSSSAVSPSTTASPPSPSRSPSPSTSESSSGQSSGQLPVGAIVGIALGAVAIILATILFVIWIRRRDRHQEMREANLHHPPTPFGPAGMPNVTPGRPPMPAPAPSTVSSSSSGWAPQNPKLANFGYDLSQSGPSHTANPSFSSSDASSSLAFQRPAQNPAMGIIHEDSGERIRFSLLQQGQGPVEHPPPYSSA